MKAILSTPGCSDQGPAGLHPAGQDRDRARGEVGHLEDLGQQHGIEGGLGGGLDHHRASGQQGRSQLDGDQYLGDVPGHDGPDHTDRLPAKQVVEVAAGPALLPRDRASHVDHGGHDVQRRPDLAQAGELDGRPVLRADGLGHLLGPAAELVDDPLHRGGALAEPVRRGHSDRSKASRAAVTAASTSAGPASGTRPITCSEWASTTSMVEDVRGATHAPPMNSLEQIRTPDLLGTPVAG